jgi:hypothetical protein
MGLFEQLWANHPGLQTPPVFEPCSTNGVRNHDNQCAIRLGVALANSGISLASYMGAFCWNGHGRSHPLRVEQMRDWLDSEEAWFIPDYAEKHRRDAQGHQKASQYFTGRRGIVGFFNFWGPGNHGDHIDLWNGSYIAKGENNYFERSQEIWFWDMS